MAETVYFNASARRPEAERIGLLAIDRVDPDVLWFAVGACDRNERRQLPKRANAVLRPLEIEQALGSRGGAGRGEL